MPAGPVRPPLCECSEKDLADLRQLLEVYADVIDTAPVAAQAR
jgi:hypothetical protein